jgi:hypothetical protein
MPLTYSGRTLLWSPHLTSTCSPHCSVANTNLSILVCSRSMSRAFTYGKHADKAFKARIGEPIWPSATSIPDPALISIYTQARLCRSQMLLQMADQRQLLLPTVLPHEKMIPRIVVAACPSYPVPWLAAQGLRRPELGSLHLIPGSLWQQFPAFVCRRPQRRMHPLLHRYVLTQPLVIEPQQCACPPLLHPPLQSPQLALGV